MSIAFDVVSVSLIVQALYSYHFDDCQFDHMFFGKVMLPVAFSMLTLLTRFLIKYNPDYL